MADEGFVWEESPTIGSAPQRWDVGIDLNLRTVFGLRDVPAGWRVNGDAGMELRNGDSNRTNIVSGWTVSMNNGVVSSTQTGPAQTYMNSSNNLFLLPEIVLPKMLVGGDGVDALALGGVQPEANGVNWRAIAMPETKWVFAVDFDLTAWLNLATIEGDPVIPRGMRWRPSLTTNEVTEEATYQQGNWIISIKDGVLHATAVPGTTPNPDAYAWIGGNHPGWYLVPLPIAQSVDRVYLGANLLLDNLEEEEELPEPVDWEWQKFTLAEKKWTFALPFDLCANYPEIPYPPKGIKATLFSSATIVEGEPPYTNINYWELSIKDGVLRGKVYQSGGSTEFAYIRRDVQLLLPVYEKKE